MQLFALGINHRTAPLAVREQLVFQPAEIGPALQELLRVPDVSEAAILSTCNRTEVYCSLATGATVASLSEWLAGYHGVPGERLSAHLYQHLQQAAALYNSPLVRRDSRESPYLESDWSSS